MDASAAQHLYGSLLFGTHVASFLSLIAVPAARNTLLDDTFRTIQQHTNVLRSTAAVHIVNVLSICRRISEDEYSATVFEPCFTAEHVDLAVSPQAIC